LQQKQAEVARWQKEIIQSQFEALKDQLNPHFLFNSLSVLTALVYQDAMVAEQFIDKLSKTYRYLLDHRDKPYVALESELGFLSNYQFLLSYRFGSKLRIDYQVLASGKKVYLPPHTLMILLEHIVSTSRMSIARPLTISLQIVQQRLLISHSLQPRPGMEHKKDKRLLALQERYDALGNGANIGTYTKENRQYFSIPLFDSLYV
jgi:LytS/YehU family sensor histidine kinase